MWQREVRQRSDHAEEPRAYAHSDTDSVASTVIEMEIKRLRDSHWLSTLEGWATPDPNSGEGNHVHQRDGEDDDEAPGPKRQKLPSIYHISDSDADDEHELFTSDAQPASHPEKGEN